MKKLSTTCFVILGLFYNTFAMWASVSLDELVRDSDLIIIGTLQSVSEYSKEDIDYGEGIILIDKIISGNVKTIDGLPLKEGDKIQLKWQNHSMIACPRVEHKGSESEKQIWLLTIGNDKNVRADYPGRSVSLDNLTEVKKHLSKQKSSNKNAKTVNTQDDEKLKFQMQSVEQTGEVIKSFSYSEEPERKEYFPFRASLIILVSVSLYYFLYRSRFKIR